MSTVADRNDSLLWIYFESHFLYFLGGRKTATWTNMDSLKHCLVSHPSTGGRLILQPWEFFRPFHNPHGLSLRFKHTLAPTDYYSKKRGRIWFHLTAFHRLPSRGKAVLSGVWRFVHSIITTSFFRNRLRKIFRILRNLWIRFSSKVWENPDLLI